MTILNDGQDTGTQVMFLTGTQVMFLSACSCVLAGLTM